MQVVQPSLRSGANPRTIDAAKVRMDRYIKSAHTAMINNMHAADLVMSDAARKALETASIKAVDLLSKLAASFIRNLGIGI